MKTPDKNRRLPAELDELLHELSDQDVERLNEVWEESEHAEQPVADAQLLGQVWSKIESQIDASQPVSVRSIKSTSAQVIPLRWMAVAATILFGAFGLAQYLKPITTTAPQGETAHVILYDGTTVELNSGSSLQYRRWFGEQRNVSLTGEAFFDVVKSEKPFMVETFNASVTVLGTTFNVRAWPNDEAASTRVSLQTGRVLLAGLYEKNAKSDTETIKLLPGQTGKVGKTALSISEIDTVQVIRALAWREGNFFFSDEWLGSILDDVERRFDTRVQVVPASLRNKRMKLALKKPGSAEAIVNDISETLGLKYRETSDGFEIFDPN